MPETNMNSIEEGVPDIDTEGLGHLSNAKVYQILQQRVKMQKQLLHAKRIIIACAVILVFLAAANIHQHVNMVDATPTSHRRLDYQVEVVHSTEESIPDGFIIDTTCGCTTPADPAWVESLCKNSQIVKVRSFDPSGDLTTTWPVCDPQVTETITVNERLTDGSASSITISSESDPNSYTFANGQFIVNATFGS